MKRVSTKPLSCGALIELTIAPHLGQSSKHHARLGAHGPEALPALILGIFREQVSRIALIGLDAREFELPQLFFERGAPLRIARRRDQALNLLDLRQNTQDQDREIDVREG